jgi:hypothetical protein
MHIASDRTRQGWVVHPRVFYFVFVKLNGCPVKRYVSVTCSTFLLELCRYKYSQSPYNSSDSVLSIFLLLSGLAHLLEANRLPQSLSCR